MKPKVLYIMSSYNIYGGTPKKTLDLMKFFKENSVLYVYNNTYQEFKYLFENTGGKVYEGFYEKNYFKHLNKLLKIVKDNNVDIVQTQFSMGETLGYLLKKFNPKIKLVAAFVGSNKPSTIKSVFLNQIYKKVDYFIYVSKYVKREKENQFPLLLKKESKVIYNGAELREDLGDGEVNLKRISILGIAGLTDIKNIKVLINAFNILVNLKKNKNIFLYIVGDGPQKKELENLTIKFNLQERVSFLGYQKNLGGLFNQCDVFVHPCYKEGFGIVVAEAMRAEKPIIVSNAGALPELIENEITGLIVDPFSPTEWANAIERLINDKDFSLKMAMSAKTVAESLYSHEKFCNNYMKLYESMLKT
tara:strand:- start:91 stop:1173 length:1083 start_codon:yes stop_codon:yes gene_type:complete